MRAKTVFSAHDGKDQFYYLNETNVEGALAETLPTHIEVIFTDNCGRVGCSRRTKEIL